MQKASSLEELNSCTASQQSLDNLKQRVRGHLQMAFNQSTRREESNDFLRQKEAIKKATNSFKAQHKASELGTVSDISEKYGLSKKKVRELKRDGKLEEYIQNIEKLIDYSVGIHLNSDVPIASYLSGGVDSSIISILSSNKYSSAADDLSFLAIPNLGKLRLAATDAGSLSKR